MLLCGFALVLFYLILRCPLFRVEPICFVMFFRTIKIPVICVTFAVFRVVLWFRHCFVLFCSQSCPLLRVEPICFVLFLRTIKIHHQHHMG